MYAKLYNFLMSVCNSECSNAAVIVGVGLVWLLAAVTCFLPFLHLFVNFVIVSDIKRGERLHCNCHTVFFMQLI